MHHIKSDARRAAYKDKLNPFGRYTPAPKRRNTASQAEQGLSPLAQSTTLPASYRPGSRQEDEIAPEQQVHRPRNRNTDPTSNSSTEKAEQFEEQSPIVTSPKEESSDPFAEKGVSKRAKTGSDQTNTTETTLQQSTSEEEKPTRRREKWNPMNLVNAHSAKHKQEELDDDNNGKEKNNFTLMGTLRATVFGSWINILLVCSPIGIALHFTNVDPVVIFVINFIAIIPLAGMLSYATEEIALRTGEVIGGLLNASFGNAVELITAIIALFQDQYLIVQTSLIGSMLSNLLLVMGMCFFAGGINRMKQSFNITVAQTAASLLFLSVSSLIIPTAFEAWANTGNEPANDVDHTTTGQTLVNGVLQLSHATAVILLLIYACYLFFQLKSHVSIYTTSGEKNKSRFTEDQKEGWKQKTGVRKLQQLKGRKSSAVDSKPPSPQYANADQESNGDEEEEQPRISFVSAVVTLAVSTALVAINAEFLVDSINAVTCGSSISKTFVGLILLPIVGNAAEHATAVTVAIKDKMDLAIGVAVGSSMQIALLVLPLVVVIGWIAGKDGMTLYFDGFQLAMLFVAVLLVNYLIADGESHWLEGVLLMMLYIIIAVAAWFYPTSAKQDGCPS